MEKYKMQGLLAVFMAVFIWSFSYIVREQLILRFHAVQIVFFQSLGAAVILLLIHTVLGKSLKISFKSALICMISGGVGIAFFQVLVNMGIKRTDSTTAAVLSGFIPLFSYLSEVFLYKKSIAGSALLSIILSLAGIFFITFHNGGNVSFHAVGYGLLILSDLVWVLYCFIYKKVENDVNIMTVLFYQVMGSAAALTPFLLSGDLSNLYPMVFRLSAGSFLFLSVCNGILAGMFFLCALQRLGVSMTNIVNNAMPAVTAGLNFVLYGICVTLWQGIGILMVLTAVILLNRRTEVTEREIMTEK